MALKRGQWALDERSGGFTLMARPSLDRTVAFQVLACAAFLIAFGGALFAFSALLGDLAALVIFGPMTVGFALAGLYFLVGYLRLAHGVIELQSDGDEVVIVDRAPLLPPRRRRFRAEDFRTLRLDTDPALLNIYSAVYMPLSANQGPFALQVDSRTHRFGGALSWTTTNQLAGQLARLLGAPIADFRTSPAPDAPVAAPRTSRPVEFETMPAGFRAIAHSDGSQIQGVRFRALIVLPLVLLSLVRLIAENGGLLSFLPVAIVLVVVAVPVTLFALKARTGRDVLEADASGLALRTELLGRAVRTRRFAASEIEGLHVSQDYLRRRRTYFGESPKGTSVIAFEADGCARSYLGGFSLTAQDAEEILARLREVLPAEAFGARDHHVPFPTVRRSWTTSAVAIGAIVLSLAVVVLPGVVIHAVQAPPRPPEVIAECERIYPGMKVIGTSLSPAETKAEDDYLFVRLRSERYPEFVMQEAYTRAPAKRDGSTAWVREPVGLEPLVDEPAMLQSLARDWPKVRPAGAGDVITVDDVGDDRTHTYDISFIDSEGNTPSVRLEYANGAWRKAGL